MRNRLYKAVTFKVREVDWLSIQVYSTIYPSPEFLFSVPLATISSAEVDLDAGRFVNYTFDMQAHKVKCEISDYAVSWFTERLDWIAVHVKSKWSFDISMSHVRQGSMTWGFSSPQEAVLFKLTF